MGKKKSSEIHLLDDPIEEKPLSGRYETTYTALGMAFQVMNSRYGMTAKELAEKFNVDDKTAKRHMKAMKEIFPIKDCDPKDFPELKDRGRGVVYMATQCYNAFLIENESERTQAIQDYKYQVDSNQFGFFEYLGVAYINDAMSGYSGSSVYTPFQMAVRKFVSELPEKTRQNFSRMRAMIVNKDSLSRRNIDDRHNRIPIINALMDCMTTQTQIVIEYKSVNSSKTNERIVEPYTLMNKDGSIYLSAVDVNDSRKMKTFKLDRILKATATKVTFDKNIKLTEELNSKQRTGVFHGEMTRVVALFQPRWETYLQETDLVPGQKLRKLKDGRIEASWDVRGIENILLDLRKFVGEVEVIEPVSLRETFIKDIQKLAEVYSITDNIASVTSNRSNSASVTSPIPTRTITKSTQQSTK